jgi:ethanolamine ammonia-lyase small subunit
MTNLVDLDPWARFRLATRARIGLGRAGDGLPTTALLDFQQAHALARDAVHGRVDFAALAAQLAPLPTLRVRSAAADRTTYLRRPDLGRRLDPDGAAALTLGAWDVAFVIGDGLSAAAVTDHAVPTIRAVLERLHGWTVAPIVLAEQARVALGDDVGARLGARMVAVLIGERPGLSVANSLGIYLTWEPRVGRRDSERNCISNIHADGLSYAQAADKLVWLMTEARARRLTGVDLKEEAGALGGPDAAVPLPGAVP